MLPWITNCCSRCGIPLPFRIQSTGETNVCGRCTGRNFSVDHCHALFNYSKPINRLISQFKFNARLDIGRCFGHLIGNALKNKLQSETTAPLLIPVPIHLRRFVQRGFNQSWELVQTAARVANLQADDGLVKKARYTPAQSSLKSAAQRRRNCLETFAVRAPVRPDDVSWVTIIDDVVTTMSTTSALAKALKNQGIQRVDVMCVARSSPNF